MIPPEEERRIRSCEECSRYNPDKEGADRCSKWMIGPKNLCSSVLMRDALRLYDLIHWPCSFHITHEEFRECSLIEGFMSCITPGHGEYKI